MGADGSKICYKNINDLYYGRSVTERRSTELPLLCEQRKNYHAMIPLTFARTGWTSAEPSGPGGAGLPVRLQNSEADIYEAEQDRGLIVSIHLT